MKIYVASSWRNPSHPHVVDTLRAEGYEVYDFKRDKGAQFHWSEIDPLWQNWTFDEYAKAINHPRAIEGFMADFEAMKWADVFVLLNPCGRSAHLEAGWAIGQGKPTAILLPEHKTFEPELMYKLALNIVGDLPSLRAWLAGVKEL